MFNYEIKIFIYRHFPLGRSIKVEGAEMLDLTDNRKILCEVARSEFAEDMQNIVIKYLVIIILSVG